MGFIAFFILASKAGGFLSRSFFLQKYIRSFYFQWPLATFPRVSCMWMCWSDRNKNTFLEALTHSNWDFWSWWNQSSRMSMIAPFYSRCNDIQEFLMELCQTSVWRHALDKLNRVLLTLLKSADWTCGCCMFLQTSVTHYCSTWKARQEIGYVSIVDKKEGIDRTVTYWKERHGRELDGPQLWVWILILGGLILLALCVYVPAPFLGPLECVRSLGLLLMQTQNRMRFTLYMAILAHIVEASYAWLLARKVDPLNAKDWFLQTLALGGLSLKYLFKRAKLRNSQRKQWYFSRCCRDHQSLILLSSFLKQQAHPTKNSILKYPSLFREKAYQNVLSLKRICKCTDLTVWLPVQKYSGVVYIGWGIHNLYAIVVGKCWFYETVMNGYNVFLLFFSMTPSHLLHPCT